MPYPQPGTLDFEMVQLMLEITRRTDEHKPVGFHRLRLRSLNELRERFRRLATRGWEKPSLFNGPQQSYYYGPHPFDAGRGT